MNVLKIIPGKNIFALKTSVLVLLAIVSPILLYFIFPPRNLYFLAWVAFTPLLLVIIQVQFRMAFFITCANGFVFYYFFYFWLNRFHPWSIYFITPFFGLLYFTLPLMIIRYLYLKNKLKTIFIAPAIWVVAEYIKSSGNLALPSGDLAISQINQTALIQFADITGQSGVSYIVFLANMAFAFFIDSILLEKQKWAATHSRLVLSLTTLFVTILLYGFFKIQTAKWGKSISVGIVQTAHYPNEKWSEKYRWFLDEYEQSVQQLAPLNPKLIVFPETALNIFYNFEGEQNTERAEEAVSKISALAKNYQIPIVIGGFEFSREYDTMRRYNSIFLFKPDGSLRSKYRKRKLVAFGESPAFNQLLPWLQEKINRDLHTIMFQTGDTSNIFTILNDDETISFGNLICFESSNGDLAREYIKNGASFLLNESSDLWSNSLDVMVQNASFSVYRAIENRVPVARSSNGGPSFYVDATGRVRQALPLGQAGVIPVQMQFLQNNFSLYKIWGDWFVYACFAVSLAGIFNLIKNKN